MRIPLEQALIGGESDCRNRLIHQMFQLVGFGDRAGSGIPKILSGWKNQHWLPPALFEKNEPEQTLLVLRMLDLFPTHVMDSLIKRFGNKFKRLDHLKQTIMALICSENTANHSRLASAIPDHPHDLTLALRHLVQNSFLESSGAGRGTVYFLPVERLISVADVFDEQSKSSVHSSDKSSVHSSDKSSVHSSDKSSVHKRIASPEHLEFPIIDKVQELDLELQAKLRTLAEPVSTKQRCEPELMKTTILTICSGCFLTLAALEVLLNRKRESLRVHYLNPMVERERTLRRAFPKTPNDPRQAYTTVDQNESD